MCVCIQVKLLRDTLEAWKKEVEKKPPSMSVDDAYEVLNLPIGQGQYVFSLYSTSFFSFPFPLSSLTIGPYIFFYFIALL